MKITSQKLHVIKLEHHKIVLTEDEGYICPMHDTDDRIYYRKADLEDLMAAFNWLYHETKEKEPK